MLSSKDIRQEFLSYFEKLNHTIVKSASVIPHDDPTLLFTNAGMNQFKDVFLGTGSRDYSRAVDLQKCIRVSGKHNDLEEVGHDTYHHTLFEMMGNWSFGDYYKAEAIEWGWKLLTEVFGLDKKRLYATIYHDDDEAFDLWKKVTDINPEHILRFDEKDNFWEMGETGPCGPCSEIHYDLGKGICPDIRPDDPASHVNDTTGRVIEIWNLVFIQNNRLPDGSLELLPNKNIDTGMGFERLTAVLQNKNSNYDTDIFQPIIKDIEKISNKSYRDEETHAIAMRVIADHIRALTVAIADGGLPSNEGRGYVLRRILRRASKYGRNLELIKPFLTELVPSVERTLGEFYPEIIEKKDYIKTIIEKEEIAFNDALDRGLKIFEEIVSELKKSGKTEISGSSAFKLYDTFGFPIDLTELLAREKGYSVDLQSFEEEMEQQKERARQSGKFVSTEKSIKWTTVSKNIASTEFVGYETLEAVSEVVKWEHSNQKLHLVTSKTPFYAEGGGQLGDKGYVMFGDTKLNVINTVKIQDDIVHIVEAKTKPTIPPKVKLIVDKLNRLYTEFNHTATHLLHKALQTVLGKHAHQQGSLVSSTRLRFDFNHFEKLSEKEIKDIENIVNQKIQENLDVETKFTSMDKAKKEGAIALFGEKYEEDVRVVSIDGFSKELCGGTHTDNTGKIGYFRVISESSIASGIRRIEAVTSQSAFEVVEREREVLNDLQLILNVPSDKLSVRIQNLLEDRKKLEKEIKRLQTSSTGSQLDDILKKVKSENGINYVAERVDVSSMDELRSLGDMVRNKISKGIAVFTSSINKKINFLCVVTDDLIKDKGYSAVPIVNEVAKIAGGKGGGKPHLAIAGAKDPSKIDDAINSVGNVIKNLD